MLERAGSRCGGRENVCLVCGDADRLPFRERSFDKVFAFTLIQNMPDPGQTVHEIVRVAKSGSRVVITALKKCFTLEKFVWLLEKSGLTVVDVMSGEDLRDHVAICTRSE
jgi:ubiquinone/menaquinone biosynthesis C-methylase UbiE